jgi:hypothetical protein
MRKRSKVMKCNLSPGGVLISSHVVMAGQGLPCGPRFHRVLGLALFRAKFPV